MKGNKGQALVEFVLIIPVLAFVLLALIDVGNIVVSKYKLEDKLDMVVELYKNNDDTLPRFISQNHLDVSYDKKSEYTTILIRNTVDIRTPGLNNFLGKKMTIKTSRMIYNE